MRETKQNEQRTEDINKRFFNAWASWYDYTPIKPWLLSVQKRIVSNLEITGNQKILDVGCGTGDALIELAEKSNAKLYGIDISERMLAHAKKKLKSRAILKLCNIESTEFKSNFFDIILCTEAFHHFSNQDTALQEMHRILKKKGILIIADINFFFPMLHKLMKLLEPGHVKLHSRQEFRQLLEKHSFNVLRQERIGLFALVTHATLSSKNRYT